MSNKTHFNHKRTNKWQSIDFIIYNHQLDSIEFYNTIKLIFEKQYILIKLAFNNCQTWQNVYECVIPSFELDRVNLC